jgi:hypothetical protein
MPAGHERLRMAALVAVGLAVRLGLAVAVAPFQAPDEGSHVRFVEAVARTGRLPVQPPTPAPHWEQYYQPPLAYLLLAPLERAAEAWGVDDATRVRVLRLLGAVWGAATVAVAYRAMALVTPAGDPRRALAALVVALLPGFAANGAAVNNDALANLLAACLWLPLLGGAGPVRVGLVLGLGCLAKLSVLALAPLVLVVPLLAGRPLGAVVRDTAVAGLVAGLVLAPWAARNVVLYGDPLAIGVGSISIDSLARVFPPEAVAHAAAPHPERALVQLFGRFGIYNNLAWPPVALVWMPLAAAGLAGWARVRRTVEDARLVRAAWAFAAALGLAALGLGVFSLRYWAAWQGRYLYVAIVPLAALLATGWAAWLPARARPWLVLALGVALVALDAGLCVRLHRHFAAVPPGRWGLAATL